jgi:hypothetical protein
MALARALPALSRANARVERSRVTPTSGSAPPSLEGGHLDAARCLSASLTLPVQMSVAFASSRSDETKLQQKVQASFA